MSQGSAMSPTGRKNRDSIKTPTSCLPRKQQQDGEVMDRLQRLEAAMESLIGEIRLSRETSGMHSTPTVDFGNDLPVFSKSPAIDDVLEARTVKETPTAAIFSIRDMLDQHSRGALGFPPKT
ncbi:hypothetical protein N7533_010433 [Penicillium manginii]|uniref:uncharacterized protein n=1 Tax=Penicillium manginii TaxID=203109 RepID=UPI002547A682|nr:uncharacterized protein N7533_010433 [Penicillium manginii]KAJ5743331.1 hypothetical protein N7533_010433 [Penicillium manginii]